MKTLRVIICIAILFILISSAFLFFSLRNGVVVKAYDTALASTAPLFRQDDEAWADDLLGKSSYTMKSSGCLTSCIASAISAEKNEVINPGELNELFSSNKVYDSEGNIQWAQIDSLDGYDVKVFNSVSEADIYQCLQEGHFPIVRVRVNGFGNYHYVLIVGIENNEYICMDPLKDDFTKLSDYWSRVYAVRVVY